MIIVFVASHTNCVSMTRIDDIFAICIILKIMYVYLNTWIGAVNLDGNPAESEQHFSRW